jgi:hypothetical protein
VGIVWSRELSDPSFPDFRGSGVHVSATPLILLAALCLGFLSNLPSLRPSNIRENQVAIRMPTSNVLKTHKSSRAVKLFCKICRLGDDFRHPWARNFSSTGWSLA